MDSQELKKNIFQSCWILCSYKSSLKLLIILLLMWVCVNTTLSNKYMLLIFYCLYTTQENTEDKVSCASHTPKEMGASILKLFYHPIQILSLFSKVGVGGCCGGQKSVKFNS